MQWLRYIESEALVSPYFFLFWALIIENLSEITDGSPIVRTPINLVQRPISSGLIKDLWIKPLLSKTSEMVKGHERKVELPGVSIGHA